MLDEISKLATLALKSNQTPVQLFCFPYAGGESDFYAKWQDKYNDISSFEVELIDYPGRGKKINSPLNTDFNELVEQLALEVNKRINKVFAFFGHSLGAIIAYEVAKKIKNDNNISPLCLFLSGCPAPQYICKIEPYKELSDAELVSKLIPFGGIPETIIQQPELLSFFFPYLKSDFLLIDTYIPLITSSFTVPIVAFLGDKDTNLSIEQAKCWKGYNENNFFEYNIMSGDHFFIKNEYPVIKKINSYLNHLIK